jgi:hypothetical protein
MWGPYPPGHFSHPSRGTEWERKLVRGQQYRVVKSFVDFDAAEHPAGETWYFIGSNFLPYDDGLSLFVADDDQQQWHIRLCWRTDQQGEICEHFAEYVQPI